MNPVIIDLFKKKREIYKKEKIRFLALYISVNHVT